MAGRADRVVTRDADNDDRAAGAADGGGGASSDSAPAIERLAADVLHELNNTFGSVLAAAHLLEAHAEDPRAVREYTEHLVAIVAAGRAQLAPLRALARADRPRP
jgi:hypothetical protein